jgi:hypothetical protein
MIAKKLLIAAVAAASLFTANATTIAPAQARDGHGGDVAVGAAAGLVGGLLLGGALANQDRVPEEEVIVERRRPVRVYEEEEVVRPRHCWREEWSDRWGDIHTRRVCR